MIRKEAFVPGEYYHLYNRGIEKRDIFRDDTERVRFQLLLRLCNTSKPVNIGLLLRELSFKELWNVDIGENLVDIGAYALMPNHFHIFVREKKEGGIVKFMSKLQTAYVMYFNKKHDRTGRLFEGSFRSRHVGEDNYFNWLFSYIHLNPVKLIDPLWKEKGISDGDKAESHMRAYPYSSYYDYYVGKRPEGKILSPREFGEKPQNDFKDILESFRVNPTSVLE